MSLPRCLLPGKTYMVTRRCVYQRYLLSPGERLHKILKRVLALACCKFGLRIHGFVFMSNHYHILLSDLSKAVNLVDFMEWLNGQLAKQLNCEFGRRGQFWESGSYHAIELTDADSVVERAVYILANPVAARAVARPEQWPGWITLPCHFGQVITSTTTPQAWRTQDPSLPQRFRLRLTCPPVFEGLGGLQEFRRRVEERLAVRLVELAEQRRLARQRVRGIAWVRSRSRDFGPLLETDDPHAECLWEEEAPRSNHEIACSDERQLAELLEERRYWQKLYREAWEDWQERHELEEPLRAFPEGTYKMRVVHRVE